MVTVTFEMARWLSPLFFFFKDGTELQLTLVRWTDKQLVAKDASGELHSVDRDDIVRMEIATLDGRKTTLLLVGAAAVGLLVYFMADVDEFGAVVCC